VIIYIYLVFLQVTKEESFSKEDEVTYDKQLSLIILEIVPCVLKFAFYFIAWRRDNNVFCFPSDRFISREKRLKDSKEMKEIQPRCVLS